MRQRIYRIIFESGTRAGRIFDIALLWLILASVATVMLESVPEIRAQWGKQLYEVEWLFTFLFTVEYVLRLVCVPERVNYARSFFGIVDFVSIAPTYLSLLFPGAQSLLVLRAFRLLRVFRILKLGAYIGQSRILMHALRRSRAKITVFLAAVLAITTSVGTLMYVIEGDENGFTSIPISVYWAIVTMTTVGYGDLAPMTGLGRFLASTLMILGYGVIAVPTGIVTAELTSVARETNSTIVCAGCGHAGHDADASHCKRCGHQLESAP